MTLTVSIPSTLASREGWCDLPTPEDKQLRRLLETGLPQATCPQCGHRATVEEVTVHRPGQTSVLRRVLRCWRQVPMGLRSNGPQGTRCPAQVLAEVPLDQGRPVFEVPSAPQAAEPSLHPCVDCGAPRPAHAKRCLPCRKRRGREQSRANQLRYLQPCADCGTPCTGQRCRACHHASRILPDCAPPPLEAPEGPRACCDCGRDISDRNARALRCVDCAGDHLRRERRAWNRRRRGQTGEAPDLPPEPPQEASETTTLPEPPPDQPEDVQGHPGPEEEHEEETSMDATTPTRTCAECGASIEHRPKIALYCEGCSSDRARRSALESYRIRQAVKRRERESAAGESPSPAPVLAPPSRALRLSVVDLACRVDGLDRLGKELVSDVLSLSPERLALLRSVLADAEEVCA